MGFFRYKPAAMAVVVAVLTAVVAVAVVRQWWWVLAVGAVLTDTPKKEEAVDAPVRGPTKGMVRAAKAVL